MNIIRSAVVIATIAVVWSIGFSHLTARGQQPARPPVSGVVQFPPDQAGPGTAPSGASPGILAPGVGSNIQVNQDLTGQPQNEPSITVNPVNPLNLVAGANDYATANGDSGCGFYSSSDGGNTWSSGTPLRGPGLQAAGDPAVAFDSVGNVYYSCLSFNRPLAANEIRVFKSTDGGTTWPTSAQVAAGTGYPSDFHDKEYLAVDTTGGTFNNNIYVTWAHYNDSGVPIKFSKSTDGGASFSVPTTISDTQNNQFSQPAVGPNGEIYVSWRDFNVDRILLDKSTDGGSTWDALGGDEQVGLITPVDSINALSRAATNPSLAVDAGPGLFRGSVYLVWHDGRYGDADILFSRSTDGGATWSSPIRINDDFTGNGKDQIFPWVSVEPDGKINIMWYDRRLDPVNRFFHIFFAQSLNGGASFKPNIQVTTVASDPCIQFSCGFIGDYLGMASSLGAAHPLWADTRNGHHDVFTASIDTLQGLPDLVVTSVSGPSNAATGTTVAISNTICNQGDTTTGVGFNVEFYLSTDAEIKNDGSDRYLGARSVGILGPGECDPGTTNIFIRTIPPWILPGTYYLGAIADGLHHVVEEGNELNNARVGNQITITPGPELVITLVSGPSIAAPGASISISHRICNQGQGKAGERPLGFSDGLYLSGDQIISKDTDTRIGAHTLYDLQPGECRNLTSNGTIPSTIAPGQYWLGGVADFTNLIQETDEDNNALLGNAITISPSNVWAIKASMPTARRELAAGVVNGIIYAVGGRTGNASTGLATVEAYNPGTNTWTTKASMPTPRSRLGIGVVNGILYAVGGRGTSGGALKTVEAYDPATNTWTTKVPMLTTRDGLAVEVVNGILYAMGGYINTSSSLASVEAYNPATNTWTAKASMPTGRYLFATGVVNGLLYAVGGYNGGAILATVVAYNPTTNSWTTKASMPTARYALAGGVINGLLYAVGGQNSGNGNLATNESYSPSTNSWTTKAPMPTGRSALAAGVANGMLFAIGGQNTGGGSTTVEAYTP